ncbi:PKD domain-containing protein [Actinoplanes sp. L3-i22]|uniref:PKD domain-containing protein n=1 Tax=Actinoplanes sp. L3-i22 TaxID=2836373 RepID=UPI001C76774A|nr:PKD domain-containing protein [Actinoplanes sp. L3-i22]BCY15043.1 hypothetical protein L3i22_101310 [Actinoplanes sp. L3-i22]
MKPRLSRPLLAAIVGGALLAGGAVATSPAYADTTGGTVATETTEPTADPTEATTTPTPEPTDTTTSPTVDPTDPTTEPTTVAPTETTTPPTEPTTEPTTVAPTETTTPPTDPTTVPPADTEAPTGTFGLNLTSIWVGQTVTVTQTEAQYADNKDADAAITRYIDFGDGTNTTLTAGQSSIAHTYAKFGTFKIAETLTDTAGNASAPIVKSVVVALPGRVSLTSHSVWPGQRFTAKVTSVPAGTLAFKLNWGDGWIDTFTGKNQNVTGYYYHYKGSESVVTGTKQLLIQYRNKNGYSSWINAGSVSVKRDAWTPVVKITKPSSSNRVKSWSVVKGTVTDTGSGAPYAYVYLTRVSGSKVYCFTAKKKWIRVYSDADYYSKCTAVAAKVVSGKWSFKVSGQAKGDLYIDAYAQDWADHLGYRGLHVKLTRS